MFYNGIFLFISTQITKVVGDSGRIFIIKETKLKRSLAEILKIIHTIKYQISPIKEGILKGHFISYIGSIIR